MRLASARGSGPIHADYANSSLLLTVLDSNVTEIKSKHVQAYSTVTDFARFLGLSTSLPRSNAAW